MTAQAYQAALERIGRDWPDHPLFGVVQAHTALNERRVVAIIQELSQKQRQEEAEEESYTTVVEEDGPEAVALFTRQSNLFVQRAKYSNLLHDCKSDRERSELVDKILDTQRRIEDVMATIRQYRQTGQVPEEKGLRLPTDGAELMRLMNSLRARISQKRRQVREAMELEQNAATKARIEEADKCIRDYQTQLTYVQKEIERRSAPVHSE